VKRDEAKYVKGGCNSLCFPREISITILYYQRDSHSKRLIDISIEYKSFDKDTFRNDYELEIKFVPLNYEELIVKFAYDWEIYLFIFILIGFFSIFIAIIYYGIVRITTKLYDPPSLKMLGMLNLIASPAFSGFIMGMVPICLSTYALNFFLKGYSISILSTAYVSSFEWALFDRSMSHYMDTKFDPALVETNQQGRMGLGFVAIGLLCIVESAFIYVPRQISRREKELTKSYKSNNVVDGSTKLKKSWKRSNVIVVSFCMGLFLVSLLEWSYWKGFGTYIWEIIFAMKIFGIFLGNIVDSQLKEALLSGPIMTSMGLIEGLMTLAAKDFIDFLLSYIVGFGFMILERMYINPCLSSVIDEVGSKLSKIRRVITVSIFSMFSTNYETQDVNNVLTENDDLNNGAAVEPILENYHSSCCDTLSLLYTPYIIFLLAVFRDETGMAKLYGIKEQDLLYYFLFAFVIIPFQIIADMFIHGSLSCMYGWKLYDYIFYANYRFLQRETKWKGFEDSHDECIDESLRSVDQMCFSNQFYLVMTIHVNGIVYLVLGIEMMIRSQYNMFGDPVMPIMCLYVFLITGIIKSTIIWLSRFLNIWEIKHKNTAWHLIVPEQNEIPGWSDIKKSINHDAFTMNKRMTEESFKHRFLNYNRSWLINQLPDLLTPQIMRRNRPDLIDQFAKALNTLNPAISSDSEAEKAPKFGAPSLNGKSRNLLRWWAQQGRRRVKMKEVVQPLILKARNPHCECCLSRASLQVDLVHSFENLDQKFSVENHTSFNQVLWRKFWIKHQRYQTLCYKCLNDYRKNKNIELETLTGKSQKYKDGGNIAHAWGAIDMSSASMDILMRWYTTAKQVISEDESISEDNEDDLLNYWWAQGPLNINKEAKTIATMWLRTARARIQK